MINITSLIDVMFLLLIFFMVSSTFKEQPGLKLELPESTVSEPTELKEIVLQVDLDEHLQVRYHLNNELIQLDKLGRNIAKIEAPDLKSLILKADRRIQHGIIVQVIDLAKQNGIKKIIIATRPSP